VVDTRSDAECEVSMIPWGRCARATSSAGKRNSRDAPSCATGETAVHAHSLPRREVLVSLRCTAHSLHRVSRTLAAESTGDQDPLPPSRRPLALLESYGD